MRLSRTGLLVRGIVIIFLLYFLPKIFFLSASEKTKGQVVRWVTQQGHRSSTSFPIIEFFYEGQAIRFRGEEYQNVELEEKVPVVFDRKDPKNARVLSFMGFWFSYLLYFAIAFIVWIFFITSFMLPTQSLHISFIKGWRIYDNQ
jgi:hypothetical protein